jgi:hypothetical protein
MRIFIQVILPSYSHLAYVFKLLYNLIKQKIRFNILLNVGYNHHHFLILLLGGIIDF